MAQDLRIVTNLDRSQMCGLGPPRASQTRQMSCSTLLGSTLVKLGYAQDGHRKTLRGSGLVLAKVSRVCRVAVHMSGWSRVKRCDS